MHHASYLLSMLLTMVASRGLAAEALDPWRAWVVFKQYARIVDESPDPGVSVQLVRYPGYWHSNLSFIRQVVERQEDDWLEPVGGVIVEFELEDPDRSHAHEELWSFEFGSFERFVDAVEQNPAIADRLVQRPIKSRIYWEDA